MASAESENTPAETVDAAEERILGRPQGTTEGETHEEDGDGEVEPAFSIDLDPHDQGTAAAAGENPD